VADEVRNLAMRAADAAKNTANLIEGTVKKIKNGSDTVAKTNEAFGKVATGAKKVGELVGEISAASSEQAQGIEQINKAVAEMDKVVQKNAASAEESASAAEEMNAQAEVMKGFVGELAAVVGGQNGINSSELGVRPPAGRAGSSETKIQGGAGKRQVGQFVNRVTNGVRKKDVKVHPKAMEPRPDHVIPMGEGDFKEF
jgi:methyl-accepting chemotaxis protein